MSAIIENPDGVTSAEIVVGIPSYNEADNIAYPTEVAARGLREFFPGYRSVIINVDNNSPDGTREAFMGADTQVPKIYVSTPPGMKGKGNNLHNLFRAATELDARAVVVVDADLQSITPNWIRYLGEPLLGRFDYVSPIYVRHKYDGTITNHIAYPLLRSLFGLRVRQPIGGDFGFSGKLARAFLAERLWSERVAHFGIDIWMTMIAIARGFNVCQAFLGTPKVHRPKDPAADLGPMFSQVISTLFDLMIKFEYIWMYTGESRPSSIFGFGLGASDQAPEVHVSTDKLYASLRRGMDTWGERWQSILPPVEWQELAEAFEHGREEDFYFSTALWARILFNFAVAWQGRPQPKDEGEEDAAGEELIEALIPLYHARVLSYVHKTSEFGVREAEEYLENILRVFEDDKPYLIKRWRQTRNSGDGLLFE